MMTGQDLPAGRQRATIAAATLADVEGDGAGRFAGYASLFGAVDLGRDAIEAGAFSASLKTRGPGGVRMLYQHDPAEPIGAWDALFEDRKGLRVEGRLTLAVARAREVHALMKAGALDGLSIGFRTVRARTDAKSGIRRILEADLWEISIVSFPMLPGARVTSVKAEAGGAGTAGGFDIDAGMRALAGRIRDGTPGRWSDGFKELAATREGCAVPADGEGRVDGQIRAASRFMENLTKGMMR